MNNDLISRRKLDGMRLVTIGFVDVKPDKRTQGWNECIDYIQKNAPTVDAEPVRHGKWEFREDDVTWWWMCSECDSAEILPTNYCPNCGAKMDGGVDDVDN